MSRTRKERYLLRRKIQLLTDVGTGAVYDYMDYDIPEMFVHELAHAVEGGFSHDSDLARLSRDVDVYFDGISDLRGDAEEERTVAAQILAMRDLEIGLSVQNELLLIEQATRGLRWFRNHTFAFGYQTTSAEQAIKTHRDAFKLEFNVVQSLMQTLYIRRLADKVVAITRKEIDDVRVVKKGGVFVLA